MENHIGAMPRTPFPASRDFAPVGSMSLDFQVASLSYKSSSFATSRGNEKIGGTGYCVTYDTDSQSRNVLASPLGEEGHEVAKGVQANWIHRGAPRPANPVRRHPAKSVWTVVILIMILDVDVTAEGGIIKLVSPVGTQPCCTTRGGAAPFFYKTCGVSRHHNPRPEGPSPPERSEHNLPPLGGHNPRVKGPSTLTPQACPKAPAAPPFL